MLQRKSCNEKESNSNKTSVEKAIKNTYLCVCMCARARARECVCSGSLACAFACLRLALLIEYATRMRHIVTSFLAFLTKPHFSSLSHKQHNFRRKKGFEHKMYVLIFSTFLSKTFVILILIQRDSHRCGKSSCTVPFILVRFK